MAKKSPGADGPDALAVDAADADTPDALTAIAGADEALVPVTADLRVTVRAAYGNPVVATPLGPVQFILEDGAYTAQVGPEYLPFFQDASRFTVVQG